MLDLEIGIWNLEFGIWNFKEQWNNMEQYC